MIQPSPRDQCSKRLDTPQIFTRGNNLPKPTIIQVIMTKDFIKRKPGLIAH